MSAPILIIEHHRLQRAAIEAAVRGVASETETADSGEGALMRLGMADFGCIVIGSPVEVDFGGESSTMLELFDRLAPALARRLIVIVDVLAIEVIQRAIQMQVFAIFLAPFDPVELRATVHSCLTGETPPLRLHGASGEIADMLTQANLGLTW